MAAVRVLGFLCPKHFFAVSARFLSSRNGRPKVLIQILGRYPGQEIRVMPRVYEATSGFVHLSERHIFSVWTPDEDGKIGIVIGPTDDHFEDELWIELADAFLASTEALFEYLKGWTFAKQNPRLVAEMTRGNGL